MTRKSVWNGHRWVMAEETPLQRVERRIANMERELSVPGAWGKTNVDSHTLDLLRHHRKDLDGTATPQEIARHKFIRDSFRDGLKEHYAIDKVFNEAIERERDAEAHE